jgi:hypothetical protein
VRTVSAVGGRHSMRPETTAGSIDGPSVHDEGAAPPRTTGIGAKASHPTTTRPECRIEGTETGPERVNQIGKPR